MDVIKLNEFVGFLKQLRPLSSSSKKIDVLKFKSLVALISREIGLESANLSPIDIDANDILENLKNNNEKFMEKFMEKFNSEIELILEVAQMYLS